jgi:signal transduction histidine kinase
MIYVADNGAGIKEEDNKKVFQKFSALNMQEPGA